MQLVSTHIPSWGKMLIAFYNCSNSISWVPINTLHNFSVGWTSGSSNEISWHLCAFWLRIRSLDQMILIAFWVSLLSSLICKRALKTESWNSNTFLFTRILYLPSIRRCKFQMSQLTQKSRNIPSKATESMVKSDKPPKFHLNYLTAQKERTYFVDWLS